MADISYEVPLSIKVDENTGLLLLVDINGKKISRAELPTDLLNLAKSKGVLSGDLPPPTDPRQTNNSAGQGGTEAATNQENKDNGTVAEQVTAENAQGPSTVQTTQENPTNGTPSPVGPSRNEDGTLATGWSTDETGQDYYVGGEYVDPGTKQLEEDARKNAEESGDEGNTRAGVPFGATRSTTFGATASWAEAKDLRVKLRVPPAYLIGPATGPANIIQKNGGILFPYTPSISFENQASYANQNPLHSNYPLYFYKNSSVGPISVTAKFTVQNEFEGAVLLGVIHLLRALTKMKFGDDPDAGAPPPVCRFDAYGDYMLYNVPVTIASWRHELPDSVDYIAVGRPGSPLTYGHSMVPSLSTITMSLNVQYSRREMLSHNVSNWLTGGLRGKGYL